MTPMLRQDPEGLPVMISLVRPNMKKIGNTTTGSVIVEMTSQEYEALAKLQGAITAVPPGRPEEHAGAATLSQTEKGCLHLRKAEEAEPEEERCSGSVD